jgi:YD repeat-containing protein
MRSVPTLHRVSPRLFRLVSVGVAAFIMSSPVHAYLLKQAEHFYTGFVGGTMQGSFATITEALNYTCISHGRPLGVYLPFAASREAAAAGDPYNRNNQHGNLQDIVCANASGGGTPLDKNQGVTSSCEAPWFNPGGSLLTSFECRLDCPASTTQVDVNGNPTSTSPAAACVDANGKSVFGVVGPNGAASPKIGNCGRNNPCDPATGMKTQTEHVYSASHAVFPFRLSLQYRSRRTDDTFDLWLGAFGTGWTSSFDRRVKFYDPAFNPSLAIHSYGVKRPDGRELEFKVPASGHVFDKTADIADTLERLVDGGGATIGWKYTSDQDEVELYDAAGLLLSVTNRAGATHQLTYSTGTSNDSSVSRYPATAPVCTLSHPAYVPGWLLGPRKLLCATDALGRQLQFRHAEKESRIVTMLDPAGQSYQFQYDSNNNLTAIVFPDTHSRAYHYNEAANINGGATCSGSPPLTNSLTGITDENGDRFATYQFDCLGRAVSTEHAHTSQKATFTYNPDGTTTVVDYVGDPASPTLVSRRYGFQTTFHVPRTASIVNPANGQAAPCAGCGGFASTTYDASGNVASRTDWNGNVTAFTQYNARNLEEVRTEALGMSLARTISTQWHATFRLPTAMAEPLRITTNAYDPDGTLCGARGALCSRSIQPTTDANGSQGFGATSSGPARIWTYTYNAAGSVLTINGPRTDVSDVTTYTYHSNDDPDPGRRGDVASIANAAGHGTQITAYNAHGQPLAMADPNGLVTTMTYDARQRLKTRTVGGELTSYDYDNAGQLTKVTLPDGSFLSYTYDDAHRVTQIQDNAGNRIDYQLDAMGNRKLEEVRDSASQLAQTRSRVFNDLNRLFRELGATSQTTEYAYDNQGNVLTVKDPLNRITTNQYDALNRLKQVTSPAPISAVTQYGYDGLDQLVSVSDPRSLVTGYTVNGLGNLTQQASPDTGTTVNTYDAAGNLLTQTDAKGQVTTYVYDALNRVALVTFHDNSTQAYAYDQGANGTGRLSTITETNSANEVTGVTAYAYNQRGRVTSETRTVAGVIGYSYDSAGRLSGLTYPSGRTVTYAFDALGRVGQITTTKQGISQLVVQNVAYHPFGAAKSYTLGNGQIYTRGIDQDGRIASYSLGSKSFAIGYDAASRVAFINDIDVPANTNTYGYDDLDRLTSAVLPATPYAYTYDAVGNRLTRTAGTSTDTYSPASTSNRIASITPSSGPVRNFSSDANGSTTADGINTYGYDTRGRMVQAVSSLGTTAYQINALGQRIRKTNSLGDTIFHYDMGGRLIGEYSPAGALKREFIYLGDIPVAVVLQ